MPEDEKARRELEHVNKLFLYEERAALKEFLGNMSREQAEREAYEEVFGVKKEEQEGLWGFSGDR